MTTTERQELAAKLIADFPNADPDFVRELVDIPRFLTVTEAERVIRSHLQRGTRWLENRA